MLGPGGFPVEPNPCRVTSGSDPSLHHAIAIDGPAASGKSTLAKRLAGKLGLIMVNSGAMYRAITWKTLREGIDPHDAARVVAMLDRISIRCGDDGIGSTITIDGVDPGEQLRGEEVNANVSAVAAIPGVRRKLIGLQRGYLDRSSIVMEGRDIGSVVFPETPFKIYVDAAEHVRAARRGDEGQVDSIARRDALDSARATAPLVVAPGAVVLDTTDLDIDAAVDAAVAILRRQGFPVPD
jgi:cytidylate kinase